jgi:hypothetical protein
MAVQNLTTARFVLKCLLDELEEYDRCIPVPRRRRPSAAALPAVAKRKSRVSRTA